MRAVIAGRSYDTFGRRDFEGGVCNRDNHDLPSTTAVYARSLKWSVTLAAELWARFELGGSRSWGRKLCGGCVVSATILIVMSCQSVQLCPYSEILVISDRRAGLPATPVASHRQPHSFGTHLV